MKNIVGKLDHEIDLLKCRLESRESDIGDWKVIKIYEYRLQGKEDPYDFESLMSARQAVRDRINKLQNELNAIDQGE